MQSQATPGANPQASEGSTSSSSPRASAEEPKVAPLTTEFHVALQEAIRNRGIGLSRIRARLQSMGVSVSVATLSYWQSGRSRPERPESLQAVDYLETVLELPRGALTSLLGPPRPRGRAAHNAKKPIKPESLLPSPNQTLKLIEQVNLPGYQSLTKLSLHDQLLIGADCVKRYQFVRQVLRAEQDGIKGFPFLTQFKDQEHGTHKLSSIAHCNIGATYSDSENNLMIAEIMFDEPLQRGESTMVEFLVENPSGAGAATYHERIVTGTVREILFDIRFVGTLPSKVTRYEKFVDVETIRDISPRGNTIQALHTDWGPGVCGVRWEW